MTANDAECDGVTMCECDGGEREREKCLHVFRADE